MKYSSLLACLSLAALSACGPSTVKDTLGLSRKAPDEFRVVSRPPLSVPPQFNLRPPSSSDESPTMVPADKQAQTLVTGGDKAPASTESNTFSIKDGAADTAVIPVTSSPLGDAPLTNNGDAQLLKNAGADKADPNVREVLIQQRITKEEAQEDTPWWDIFGTSNTEKKDAQVNAQAEADRIKANKDAGKPVTDGDTPETKDKDRGLLGHIFSW